MVKNSTGKKTKNTVQTKKPQRKSKKPVVEEYESDVESDIASDIESEEELVDSDVETEEEIIEKKTKKPTKKPKKQQKKSKKTVAESEEIIEKKSKKSKGKYESDSEELVKKKSKKKSKNKATNNRILEIKTRHTGAIKQVLNMISNCVSDSCIVFVRPDENDYNSEDESYYEELDENTSMTSKNNKNKKPNRGGIRLVKLTEDKTILLKLSLYACEFDYFRCDDPKITIGVDMANLHSKMKSISDDEPIIIYMNRYDQSRLYIRSINDDNDDTCEETDIEIFLMQIENDDIPLPPVDFPNKITMASDKFNTICKHLNNNATYVEITSINKEILFAGQSDGGKITKSYRDNNYKKKKKNKMDQVVQGKYELKNLLGFSKCNKLCQTIDIYLKNDFPLVLVISVDKLGKLYVFVTPIEENE